MNVKLDGLTLHVEPDYNPPHPRTECDLSLIHISEPTRP